MGQITPPKHLSLRVQVQALSFHLELVCRMSALPPHLAPCIHSTPRARAMLTDLLVPRSPTKGARTDAAITALGGEFHRTEGHGSWDMAQEAYCPGHGSPGHVRACSPGPPPFGACGARTRDGHVASEAAPANSGPGGSGSRPAPGMFSMRFLVYSE